MDRSRKLVIIDDELFSHIDTIEDIEKVTGVVPIEDGKRVKTAYIIPETQFAFIYDKIALSLRKIFAHAMKGRFYGLREIWVLDLREDILDDIFSETGKLKSLHNNPELPLETIAEETAILLDIFNNKERFPTGLEIAESLDQTDYANRIAWLSVTHNLSYEYKPYPLILKSDIPEELETINKKYTIFLWWARLFGDATIKDPITDLILVTKDNVVAMAENLYLSSGKNARKGGLAGNMLNEILWLEDEGTNKGKISNAFLKICGDITKSLSNEVKFIKSHTNQLQLTEIFNCAEEAQRPFFYCMKKADGVSFSDFVFSQITHDKTTICLQNILRAIDSYHNISSKKDTSGELVLDSIKKIEQRLDDWVNQNPMFEPMVQSDHIVINNRRRLNARTLCGLIRERYDAINTIEPLKKILVHGDVVAQNIFVTGANITFIDPRAEETDYLQDYCKLYSSFSAQGHIEYLTKNPDSKCAYFYVNDGFEIDKCYYACSPPLKGFKGLRSIIINHIQDRQLSTYKECERNPDNWKYRFYLGMTKQYLGGPPYRDGKRFHEEMKLLYYIGVEYLNEFCQMMRFI